MKRHVTKIQLGERKQQETVRIEGDDSAGPDDGNAGYRSFWDFVAVLQANPTLLRHSVECPTDFSIRHSGRNWFLESHAIVPSETDAS